jgi:hypothetical protein
MVVDLCAPITHPPYITFIRMGKVVLNYATFLGRQPSHKM